MRPLRSTALACLLLTLAACDATAGDAVVEENMFSLRVGDGETTIRSEAHFGSYVSAETGGTFALLLGTRPISAVASLTVPVVGFAHDGASIRPGTYPLAPVNPSGDPPEDQFIGVYIDPAEFAPGTIGESGFYYTGEGEITIDTVDGDHARGTFRMWAVQLDADLAPSDVGVEVTGEFYAVHTDAFGSEDAFWQ